MEERQTIKIHVKIPGPRRYAFLSATKYLHYPFKTISLAILPKTTYEFGAVVSLELQLLHINSATEQTLAENPAKQTVHIEITYLLRKQGAKE